MATLINRDSLLDYIGLVTVTVNDFFSTSCSMKVTA